VKKYGLHVNVSEIALKEETRLKLAKKKNTAEVAKLLLILPVNSAGTSLYNPLCF
jgi:hypothetical protein